MLSFWSFLSLKTKNFNFFMPFPEKKMAILSSSIPKEMESVTLSSCGRTQKRGGLAGSFSTFTISSFVFHDWMDLLYWLLSATLRIVRNSSVFLSPIPSPVLPMAMVLNTHVKPWLQDSSSNTDVHSEGEHWIKFRPHIRQGQQESESWMSEGSKSSNHVRWGYRWSRWRPRDATFWEFSHLFRFSCSSPEVC